MTNQPYQRQGLLTPDQAAQRLLEEATLLAYRTNGAAGLRPVQEAGQLFYRASDVDALIKVEAVIP